MDQKSFTFMFKYMTVSKVKKRQENCEVHRWSFLASHLTPLITLAKRILQLTCTQGCATQLPVEIISLNFGDRKETNAQSYSLGSTSLELK